MQRCLVLSKWMTNTSWCGEPKEFPTIIYLLAVFFSSLTHCMNKTITLQYKLHDPCKQMEGHDTAINGCVVDQVAAASHCESSHGRASLQMRPAILWWKQSQNSEWCKLKGVKHNRVKRANPAFCSRCLYCAVCARHGVIFLTLPMKRSLIFTGQLTC